VGERLGIWIVQTPSDGYVHFVTTGTVWEQTIAMHVDMHLRIFAELARIGTVWERIIAITAVQSFEAKSKKKYP